MSNRCRDPFLSKVGEDDLLSGRVLGDEALMMEGENGVKRAVAAALDAAFAGLGDDVGIVPVQLGGDAPERGAVELPLPWEDGGAG